MYYFDLRERIVKFKEIMDIIKKYSTSLSNKDFVSFITEKLIFSYSLKNSKGGEPKMSDNRVSELIYSNILPPSLRTAFLFDDFSEILSGIAEDFFFEYQEQITDQAKLSKELNIRYSEYHEYKEPEFSHADDISKSLFYCLFDFFESQYNNHMNNRVLTKHPEQMSVFSVIIKELLNQCNKPVYVKHSVSYKIEDKIRENDLNDNAKAMIEESIDDYYDCIENTFTILSEGNVVTKQIFLNLLRSYYFEYLNNHNISINDKDKIRIKSNDIINWMKCKICVEIENCNNISCYSELVPVYSFALVVYAFYKCRILLKVDGEK